jgi:ribosomal protein S18 acetylase RimI-like enzyme
MTDISIRPSRPGDGVAFAELWREMGSLFASLNPHTFRTPAAEGLAEWFEELAALGRADQNRIRLVAEVDGAMAGIILATLHEPIDPHGRELQTDLNRWRLHIDVLCVAGTYRRDGVGSALMRSAEEWGHERGAEVVILETETNNPMSVPFYEQRMGFSAEALIFRKEIDPTVPLS